MSSLILLLIFCSIFLNPKAKVLDLKVELLTLLSRKRTRTIRRIRKVVLSGLLQDVLGGADCDHDVRAEFVEDLLAGGQLALGGGQVGAGYAGLGEEEVGVVEDAG